MLIVIAGALIASVGSSILLISALAVGRRGDAWSDEAYEQKLTPAPVQATKDPRMNKPLPRAGSTR